MKEKIKSILVPILLCIYMTSFGQSPINDLNWELDTARSDEFNGTSVNATKWNVIDLNQGDCCNWGGDSYFKSNKTSVSNGELIFTVDGTGPNSDDYYTGGIMTWGPDHPFGYFEIEAILPGFYDGTTPIGRKFWPCFWLDTSKWSSTIPNCKEENLEIDILEPNGIQYEDGSTNVMGWWHAIGDCQTQKRESTFKNSTPLFSNYHKYAAEWTEDKVIYYLDDVPIFEGRGSEFAYGGSIKVYIDLQIHDAVEFHPNMTFPQYMKVKYFRFYKLKKDCSNNAIIGNNTDLTNYVFAVKSSLLIGNGGTVTFGSTDKKTFRAVNGITLNGDVTIPSGAEILLLPTPCN